MKYHQEMQRAGHGATAIAAMASSLSNQQAKASASRPMKRPFHFSLRSIFAIVLMAAVVAWMARASIEMALIVVAALIGAGLAPRPLWPLLGGLVGTVAACAVIATVRHYQYPPIHNSFTRYHVLQDRERELRILFEVGICVGVYVGYWMASIKELRHCYRTRVWPFERRYFKRSSSEQVHVADQPKR